MFIEQQDALKYIIYNIKHKNIKYFKIQVNVY